ncbi:MAG TPA: hypothetical protein VMB81_25975 [Candidatus Sulfotelmatobacter sp.]|nr:hypothetical protein [Candidatus Sulfotelmatobacter sp.]
MIPTGSRIAAPAPGADAQPTLPLPALVRFAVVLAIVSFTILQRFGLNLGGYSVDLALITQYFLVVSLLLTRLAHVDHASLTLFTACLVVALASCLLNVQQSSIGSLALLLIIYLPFIFHIRPEAEVGVGWHWMLGVYSNVALFCALCGIMQFAAQFAIHQPWLFNFDSDIPSAIRGNNDPYNTVIAVGSLYKSNGFFFVEPSHFSQTMGIALIVEIVLLKRLLRIGLLGCALLLSYSGTGLAVLLIAMMFPLGRKTAIRLALLSGFGVLIYWGLGDLLNLGFTLNRVDEFNQEGSSGSARFVSPLLLLWWGFDTDAWSAILGHGPGMILRAIERTTRPHDFFDPTWAKLAYDYGLLGLTLFVLFVASILNRSRAPSELRVGLFVMWLVMGGYLLIPMKTVELQVLALLWPAGAALRRRGARSSASPMFVGQPTSA